MTTRVLLVSMPWTMFLEPSLGLGILKASLEAAGIPNRVAHLNLLLLKYLRPESYEAIAANYALNDFLFTRVLQDDAVTPRQLAALQRMLRSTHGQVDLRAREQTDLTRYVDFALRCRNEIVPKFLADCMEAVDASNATMVGFTCMFDQTLASVALAKLIKAAYPDKLVVLGGYAVEPPVGPMLLRAFPFLDAVCHGEGEEKIVPLALASVDRARLGDVPGLSYRAPTGGIARTASAAPIDLEGSPVPDYDDWFGDLTRLDAEHAVAIRTGDLPIESSRGCWWGERSHCTFCGIDDETMRYRYKSPQRTKETLAVLRRRHGISSFRFSDYILPRAYYKTLLPDLATEQPPYVLHWEMKANVRFEDVQVMRKAGIDRVQPGIESFSTSVLRKMAKGVTAIQNVLTIRLLMEQEVTVFYNVLYGFPDDEPDEYREMCRRLPLLYHFTPPTSYVPVLTTRYAPLHSDPARFGITAPLRADPRYHMIFSDAFLDTSGFELDEYCYVFERPYPIPRALQQQFDVLVYQLHHWRAEHQTRMPALAYEVAADGILFSDTRYRTEPARHAFGRDHAAVHEGITREIVLQEHLAARTDLSASRVAQVLDDLEADRLVYREGAKLTALALPTSCYARWAEKARARADNLERQQRNREAAPITTG